MMLTLFTCEYGYASNDDTQDALNQSQKLRTVLENLASSNKSNFRTSVRSEVNQEFKFLKSEEDNNQYINREEVDKDDNLRLERSDCVVFEFESNKSYDVYVRNGFVTDITLPFGECLQSIKLGDKNRFSVETFDNANGDGCWHIYINPVQKDIETNMVITTDKNNYQLKLIAGELFFPIVKWKLKQIPDMADVFGLNNNINTAVAMEVEKVSDLNFSYDKGAKAKYSWAPQNVFDDKHWNTYFVFKTGRLQYVNPIVFASEIDGSLTLMPYEKVGDTLVVHKVCKEFMLRVKNETIKFSRR